MRTWMVLALVLLHLLLSLPIARAASEAVGTATIPVPAGWTRSENKSAVSFSKTTGTTYGQIAYYRARTATGVSAEAEFDAEWAELVTKTMVAPVPKKRATTTREDGVVTVGGSSTRTNLAGTTVYLHVLIEGGRVSSIRSSTSDPAAFLPEIDAFVAGVRFAASPAAVAAVASSGDPNVSSDPARVPGKWRRNTSAANTSVTYWDPSYVRSLYDLKAGGTYTFTQERWQKITPDDFWFVEESGSWKVDGGALVISPKKSTLLLKTREGKVRKTEAQALEEVRYLWHFRTFTGIQETDLVLTPSNAKETIRDRVFSWNDLEPNSYLYAPEK